MNGLAMIIQVEIAIDISVQAPLRNRDRRSAKCA